MSQTIGLPVVESCGVILVTPESHVIVNLRDDKPGIASPNMLSFIGGVVDPGEKPLDCIVREVEEETLLSLPSDRFDVFDTVRTIAPAVPDRYPEHLVIGHIFIARGIDPASIDLQEGQGIDIITSLADLERRSNVAPHVVPILRKYFGIESAAKEALLQGPLETVPRAA